MRVGARRGATGERKEEGVGREVGTWGKNERPAVGDKEKKGEKKTRNKEAVCPTQLR